MTTLSSGKSKPPSLRLGGPTFEKFDSPGAWVRIIKELGYRAAYCPVGPGEKDDVITAYADAARRADIVLAEVGAWSNPISPDEKVRQKALAKCCTSHNRRCEACADLLHFGDHALGLPRLG
ncbi:MAG: hypothetical protein ACYSTZ_13165 [Planctomycetota bacterium]